MRSLMFALMMIGFIFFAGLGVGFIGGWLSDPDPASVWFPVIGVIVIVLSCGGLYWGFKRYKGKNPDDDVSDIDMIFGDMSDPVQRNIILRVVVASAIHGMVLMSFLDMPDVPITLGDGPLERPEIMTLASYVIFMMTLIWIVVECIRFHRIDEFWTRIVLGPAALAGAILFMAIILWMLGEEALALPEARFWHFYLFYYLTLLGLMIGKWQLGRRRGGI